MSQTQIAVIVGSLRKDSINRKLAQALTTLAPADFTLKIVEIGDLPLYNQDDDAQQAASVLRMKAEIAAAQGVIFVTPEYNRSIPGVLKNALDTASRPWGTNSFAGKPSAVIGASVGAIGTAVAQQHLRSILSFLASPELAQPEGYLQMRDGLIADDGDVTDASTEEFLLSWLKAVHTHIAKSLSTEV